MPTIKIDTIIELRDKISKMYLKDDLRARGVDLNNFLITSGMEWGFDYAMSRVETMLDKIIYDEKDKT